MELPALSALPALPALPPLSRLPTLPALSTIAAPPLPSRPVAAAPVSIPVSIPASIPASIPTTIPSVVPTSVPVPDAVVIPSSAPVPSSVPESAAPSTAPTTPVVTAVSPPRKSASSPSRPAAHGSTDAVLPRGSLVKIVGNNRTKGDLVGREGIVQGAQTLGGWHEVQLYDNSTVRVQRNALMLLKVADATLLSMLQPAPPRPSSHVLSASVASRGTKRRRRLAAVDDARAPRVCANIAKLQSKSLRKYRSHYNLPVASDCSRDELVVAVKRHFARNTVDEAKVIAGFIRFMKTPRTRAARGEASHGRNNIPNERGDASQTREE